MTQYLYFLGYTCILEAANTYGNRSFRIQKKVITYCLKVNVHCNHMVYIL